MEKDNNLMLKEFPKIQENIGKKHEKLEKFWKKTSIKNKDFFFAFLSFRAVSTFW